jgi:hypothetical protein
MTIPLPGAETGDVNFALSIDVTTTAAVLARLHHVQTELRRAGRSGYVGSEGALRTSCVGDATSRVIDRSVGPAR